MLELTNVNAYYGRIRALKDISLHVDEGKIVSLLGANGAGKTTTVRTIVGLNRSAANDIRFEGRQIGKIPAPWSAGRPISASGRVSRVAAATSRPSRAGWGSGCSRGSCRRSCVRR